MPDTFKLKEGYFEEFSELVLNVESYLKKNSKATLKKFHMMMALLGADTYKKSLVVDETIKNTTAKTIERIKHLEEKDKRAIIIEKKDAVKLENVIAKTIKAFVIY